MTIHNHIPCILNEKFWSWNKFAKLLCYSMSTNSLNPILRQWIELNFFKKIQMIKQWLGGNFCCSWLGKGKKKLFFAFDFFCVFNCLSFWQVSFRVCWCILMCFSRMARLLTESSQAWCSSQWGTGPSGPWRWELTFPPISTGCLEQGCLPWRLSSCCQCAILFTSCRKWIESGIPSDTVISSIVLLACNAHFRW